MTNKNKAFFGLWCRELSVSRRKKAVKAESTRWCSSLSCPFLHFFHSICFLISGQQQAHLGSSILIVWVLVTVFLYVLMTYWRMTDFHLSGPSWPLKCPAVPTSKVSLRTFAPFWSSPCFFPPSAFIYLKLRRPHTTSRAYSAPFEPSRRTNVVKTKRGEEGWQACVAEERFTWGHKNWPERERAIAHIEGSMCGDTEVNWPSQSESWTAHIHHLHALPFTPCPPALDF